MPVIDRGSGVPSLRLPFREAGRLEPPIEGVALRFDRGGELRPTSEVLKLIGVCPHVVELLASIGVLNVAPIFTANTVVVVVVGGNGGPFAWRLSIE